MMFHGQEQYGTNVRKSVLHFQLFIYLADFIQLRIVFSDGLTFALELESGSSSLLSLHLARLFLDI